MVDWEMYRDYGPVVLRIALGVAFLVAGLEKVIGFEMVSGMFSQLFGGAGTAMLVLAILIELVCGLALVVGFYARWAALPLLVLIAVAFASTFKINPDATGISMLREIMVMNTGGGNTAVNFAYFFGLLSLFLTGSSVGAVKPD